MQNPRSCRAIRDTLPLASLLIQALERPREKLYESRPFRPRRSVQRADEVSLHDVRPRRAGSSTHSGSQQIRTGAASSHRACDAPVVRCHHPHLGGRDAEPRRGRLVHLASRLELTACLHRHDFVQQESDSRLARLSPRRIERRDASAPPSGTPPRASVRG